MSYVSMEISGYAMVYDPESLVWDAPNDIVEQRLTGRGRSTAFFGGPFMDMITFDGYCDEVDLAQLLTYRDYNRIVTLKGDIVAQKYGTSQTLFCLIEEITFNEQAGFTSPDDRVYPYKFRLRKVGDADHYKRATVCQTSYIPHCFSFTPKPVVGLPTGCTSLSQSYFDTYTKLLLHMDGVDTSTSFLDSSYMAHTITANGNSQIYAPTSPMGYSTVGAASVAVRTPKVMTPVGNAQLDTAQSVFGGASCLFNGAGDSLTTPDSIDLAFGTGDFTIDLWVKFNAAPTDAKWTMFASQYASANYYWWFAIRRDGATYRLDYYNYYLSGQDVIIQKTLTGAPSTGVWYHYAVVRSGSNWYMFADGTQVGTTGSDADNLLPMPLSPVLAIGRQASYASAADLNGWIDELRISKGIARWTANFTPPTVRYSADQYNILLLHFDGSDGSTTAIDDVITGSARATKCVTTNTMLVDTLTFYSHVAGNARLAIYDSTAGTETTNTKLLIHMEGTDGATMIIDSSGNARPIVLLGNAQLDTAQKKFGSSSLLLDGSGDYGTLPDSSDWALGTSNFTIDGWVRYNVLPASGQAEVICGQYVDASNSWRVYINASGTTMYLYFYVRSGAVDTVIAYGQTNPNIAINTWYHLAVVRSGTQFYIFQNGVPLSLTGGVDADTVPDLASPLYIGQSGASTMYHNGWIDELRITSSALWTADFSASLPAAATDQTYPNSKLWESADTAVIAGVNTVNISSGTPTSLTLTAGTYFVAQQFNPTAVDSINIYGASYSAGTIQDGNCMYQAYGAFPATWTSWPTYEKWTEYFATTFKFNQAGIFDGTGDFLSTIDSSDWNFGSENFTVECWVKFIALPGAGDWMTILSQHQDTDNRFEFSMQNTGTYEWTLIAKSGGLTITSTSKDSPGLSVGVWYHIAFVRSGNTCYIFQDGTLCESTGTFVGSMPDATADLEVGRWNGSQYFNGLIDELRVTNGIARWITNFTPESSAYTFPYRTGEDGPIPIVPNFKGNKLYYDIPEANLEDNNVTIIRSNDEVGISNGLVKIQSRNNEMTNKGNFDVYYYDRSEPGWLYLGQLEIQAYDSAWNTMKDQYCTIESMVEDDSEYGSIYGLWEATSGDCTMIVEIELFRGKPYFGIRLTNAGTATIKGMIYRLNIDSAWADQFRYWVHGATTEDAQSGAHGTPDTVSATADDYAYQYLMTTATIAYGTPYAGFMTRTRANGRSYEAYDLTNSWSYIDFKFDGTNMSNVTTGNELEQVWLCAKYYETSDDDPSELAEECMAPVDQSQDLVRVS